MSTLLVLRKIALLIQLLKMELKRSNRNKLGDPDLASLLNAAQSKPPLFHFTNGNVNELFHAKKELDAPEEAAVLSAIQQLINTSTTHRFDVRKNLPRWVEDRCAPELREALRHEPASEMMQGETLADRRPLLSGPWTFFWVTLPMREALSPVIFRFGLFFHPASSNHMSVSIVSRSSEWRGFAHINGAFLHMYLRDVADTKSASFITDLPVKGKLRLSGVGITLEPKWQERPHQAVIGFVCFAEKWDAAQVGDRDLAVAVDRLMDTSGSISDADLNKIREGFIKEYGTVKEFAGDYPRLAQYMKNHRINGESGFPLHHLHLAFS